MVAPNPLAARRLTNSISFSVAVPSSWEESVVSGAIANRFAISRPLLNLKGDQTTIDQTSTMQLFDSGTNGASHGNALSFKKRCGAGVGILPHFMERAFESCLARGL
jgi:hypothetical protein